jgi:choline dehydrogenase-like flavoprotein
MITRSLEHVRADHFDHCVVGAGPVGLTLALELARRGRRVLVLESGGTASDPRTQALSEADFAEPNAHDDMRIAVARRLGGTSNLWGGRCVPYDPIDFADRPGVLGPLWPIRLEDIAPVADPARGHRRVLPERLRLRLLWRPGLSVADS